MRGFGIRSRVATAVVLLAVAGGTLAAATINADAATTNVLLAGRQMTPGQQLVNGSFRFVYQTDGNLVIYDKGNQALWSSRTNGKKSTRLLLQKSDGNLVLYNGGTPVWAPPLNVAVGHPNDVVDMQSDGNLVIYQQGRAIWATGTAASCDSGEVCLYDGTGASGLAGFDTRSADIGDYAAIKFHNGTSANNHVSSVRNNSASPECFYTGANRTEFFPVCLVARSVKGSLGVFDNQFSSQAMIANDPFLACTRAHESDTAGGYTAYNPAGPAYGAYQFLQGTWNSAAAHAGRPDLVGKDPRSVSPRDQDWVAMDLLEWQGRGHWGSRCAGLV